MLQAYKNEVVADVGVRQASLRQLELDYYVSNYWLWCGASTFIGGFLFSQLTNEIPYDCPYLLSCLYLCFTCAAFGCSICVVTWAVFLAMWGPGLALRGSDGLTSYNAAVDFLKSQQESVYRTFQYEIFFYFCSSGLLLWVFPARFYVNLTCMALFAAIALGVVGLQKWMTRKLKGFGVSTSKTNDGVIKNFSSALTRVTDLDSASTKAYFETERGIAIDGGEHDQHPSSSSHLDALRTIPPASYTAKKVHGGGLFDSMSGSTGHHHGGGGLLSQSTSSYGDTKQGRHHPGLYDSAHNLYAGPDYGESSDDGITYNSYLFDSGHSIGIER